ncbi:MAG: biopolymer transporter ExbD [Planctomycetota bacterium]
MKARSGGRIAMGGLTPLLDTLFLLLFALLAISDVKREEAEEEVLVELPGVAPDSAPSESPLERIGIVVDAESRLSIGPASAAATTPNELDAVLDAELAGRDPARVAIEIRADRDSRHGVSVALLQHLRTRGFQDVVLVAIGAPDPDAAFGGVEATR